MEKKNYDDLIKKSPLLQKMQRGEEVVWINPDLCPFETAENNTELTMADIEDAEK